MGSDNDEEDLSSYDSENNKVTLKENNYFAFSFQSSESEVERNFNFCKRPSDSLTSGSVLLKSLEISSCESDNEGDQTLICSIQDIPNNNLETGYKSEEVDNSQESACELEEDFYHQMETRDVPFPDTMKAVLEEFHDGGFQSTFVPDLDDAFNNKEPSGDLSENSDRASNFGQNISDYWDEESYLSEYFYEEEIDNEKAHMLLNFGDDYRNFIDSLSEDQKSIQNGNQKIRKRLKKFKKHKQIDVAKYEDTCSDSEADQLSSV